MTSLRIRTSCEQVVPTAQEFWTALLLDEVVPGEQWGAPKGVQPHSSIFIKHMGRMKERTGNKENSNVH